MLSENRIYQFLGRLKLRRSHILDEDYLPMNDEVNWLFLKSGERQFSFIYKIANPLEAKYDKPFTAEIWFTMFETLKKELKLNNTYEVLRGKELIGTLTLTNSLV